MLDGTTEVEVLRNLQTAESLLLLFIGLALISRFFIDEFKRNKLDPFDYITLMASTLVASRGVLKLIITQGMWMKAKHGGIWIPAVVLVIPTCTLAIQFFISRRRD